jgi:hypothetical protein
VRRGAHVHGSKEDLDTKFKDENDPLRVVFVCAMWMTGFDVPSCGAVYLDKPMKNHSLMQTIARANRVFEGTVNGLIVDYIGVFRNLQKALAIYGSEAGGGVRKGDSPVQPKEVQLAELGRLIREATTADWGVLTDLARGIQGEETPVDISAVMEKVESLLDESIDAAGYVIREPGRTPEDGRIHLGKIDFELLTRFFDKAKHKATSADALGASSSCRGSRPACSATWFRCTTSPWRPGRSAPRKSPRPPAGRRCRSGARSTRGCSSHGWPAVRWRMWFLTGATACSGRSRPARRRERWPWRGGVSWWSCARTGTRIWGGATR